MKSNCGYRRGMKIWLLPLVILFSAKKVTARDYLAEAKDVFPTSKSSPIISSHEQEEESSISSSDLNLEKSIQKYKVTRVDEKEIKSEAESLEEFTLLSFPNETLLHMISFMKVKEACRFYQTCKTLWKLRDDLPSWTKRIQVAQWFTDLNPFKNNLFPLKKRLLLQDSFFTLHNALKINVNGLKRGVVNIQSSMSADHLFSCLKSIPSHFFTGNKDFQWLKWIATAPLLADGKKLGQVAVWLNPDYKTRAKLGKREIFHYWRDQIKTLVPNKHTLASFTFALLSQVLPSNAGITFDVEFLSPSPVTAKFVVETYPPSFEGGDLVTQAFTEAVEAKIPTAAYEYAKYLEPSLDDIHEDEVLYKDLMKIAEEEDNWSGEQAYTLYN